MTLGRITESLNLHSVRLFQYYLFLHTIHRFIIFVIFYHRPKIGEHELDVVRNTPLYSRSKCVHIVSSQTSKPLHHLLYLFYDVISNTGTNSASPQTNNLDQRQHGPLPTHRPPPRQRHTRRPRTQLRRHLLAQPLRQPTGPGARDTRILLRRHIQHQCCGSISRCLSHVGYVPLCVASRNDVPACFY